MTATTDACPARLGHWVDDFALRPGSLGGATVDTIQLATLASVLARHLGITVPDQQ